MYIFLLIFYFAISALTASDTGVALGSGVQARPMRGAAPFSPQQQINAESCQSCSRAL